MILSSGCNSSVGTGGGGGGNNGGNFSTCYAIGFSNQSIANIYDAATNDRANGAPYSQESQVATNACIEGCNYEAVCANGCTSCAYEIINVAYSKLQEQLAKNSIGENSTISIIIKDLLLTDP